MDKIKESYIRWVFELDRRTPKYWTRQKIQKEKLRERAGKKTWGFEKRLEEGKRSDLVRLCWEKIKGRFKKGKTGSKWKKKKNLFWG